MTPTLVTVFWFALGIAIVGTIGRILFWVNGVRAGKNVSVGPSMEGRTSGEDPGTERMRSVFHPDRFRRAVSVGAACFGVFVADVLMGRRFVQRDPIRGIAHVAIVIGCGGLLFLHALHDVIPAKLISGFSTRLNPWLFLRDVCGLFVVGGLATLALSRKRQRHGLPPIRKRDPCFLTLVWVILGSGFLLASAKIISADSFERMAREYASAQGAELASLRTLWAVEYGVVFPERPEASSPGPETLAAGRKLDDESCSSCHARPQYAFVSYTLSRGMKGIAGPLGRLNAEKWLYVLHVLACFVLLAYLPFGRFFHIVASPIALMRTSVMQTTPLGLAGRDLEGRGWEDRSDKVLPTGASPSAPDSALGSPPVGLYRTPPRLVGQGEHVYAAQRLDWDACVRCGYCDETCSVRALTILRKDDLFLPSARVFASRELLRRLGDLPFEMGSFAEGVFVCTECQRCSGRCPVAVNLAGLFAGQKSILDSLGVHHPRRHAQRLAPLELAEIMAREEAPPDELPIPRLLHLLDSAAFTLCLECQTCTNVCPVVAEAGARDLHGATPQKVMNLLRLGLLHFAMASPMVWNCATCYQCQEQCPAGIRVTDILSELRQKGSARLRRFLVRTSQDPRMSHPESSLGLGSRTMQRE